MAPEKKVVEDVSGWLRLYDDGSVDRLWAGPPEIEFMVKPVIPHDGFIDGVATRDVTIDPNSGLSVRIYIPERKPDDDDDPKLPVIFHFHGGGFCFSEADWYMYYHFYTCLVRSARAVCVSVLKMRLAPEHRLPAAIDDCYSVLLWLRSVARAELAEPWLKAHADLGRVFLVGDSTGGNLVHHVTARAGKEEWDPLKLAGGVILYPGFVQAERSKSEMELRFESPFLTRHMVDKLPIGLPLGSTRDHPFICPMGPAAPPLEGLKLPPFLVAVADNDLMRDTQLEYCEAMKKAGKDVEVLISNGVSHCFYLNKIAIDLDPHTAVQTNLLIERIVEFIKRH